MDRYYWQITERIPGKSLISLMNIIVEIAMHCVSTIYPIFEEIMMQQQSNDPLHGKTLEMILNALVTHYGWKELGERIRINCFISDPSIKSSLKFLRKTPWARKKVEDLYISTSFIH
jgi:hypothetical protein